MGLAVNRTTVTNLTVRQKHWETFEGSRKNVNRKKNLATKVKVATSVIKVFMSFSPASLSCVLEARKTDICFGNRTCRMCLPNM